MSLSARTPAEVAGRIVIKIHASAGSEPGAKVRVAEPAVTVPPVAAEMSTDPAGGWNACDWGAGLAVVDEVTRLSAVLSGLLDAVAEVASAPGGPRPAFTMSRVPLATPEPA
ncbi:hypothetical protein GCM10027414_14150 [Humibacter ginsengiterrae]